MKLSRTEATDLLRERLRVALAPRIAGRVLSPELRDELLPIILNTIRDFEEEFGLGNDDGG